MANTYSNVGGTGSGEANTASSRGVDPDKEIVAGKEGVDLKFKRISAGNGVTLDSDDDKVIINATGGAANAFSTIQAPIGTPLDADSDTDTLHFTSSNGSVTIETSEAPEDTINFTVNNSLLGLNDTTIISPQAGEVLTYNSNSFRWENAPASGGVTIIEIGGALSGTYDGDVVCRGNAQLRADVSNTVVIKGSLYLENGSTINTQAGNSYTLTVYGDVYCRDLGSPAVIDLRSTQFGFSGFPFTCNGSVYNCDINTSFDSIGVPPSDGGNVTIKGDYIAPNSDIIADGGRITGAYDFPAGNGGSIEIGGNALFNIISSKGGDHNSTVPTSNNGGNGGDIVIAGDAKSTFTGACFVFSGGVAGTNAVNGGNAGSLFVGSDLTVAGNITGVGGQSNSGTGANGGTGGSLVVSGTSFFNEANLSGGNGTISGGSGNQTANKVYFSHKVVCNILNISGGDAGTGAGGSGARFPTFKGGLNISTRLDLSGGNGGSTNGASSQFCTIEGGGYVKLIDMEEGTGGSVSTTASSLFLNDGFYNIEEIKTTIKFGQEQRVVGESSVLSLQNFSGIQELQNGAGTTLATTPTELLESIYKFGTFNAPIERIASGGGATTLDELTDTNLLDIATDRILQYNGLDWVPVVANLDLLDDVNTAGAVDGQVLTYNSGTWAPAAAGGSGGATVVPNLGTVGGTIDGDLIIEGNATVTASLEVKGNVYFLKSASVAVLNAQNTGFSIEVHGNVIAPADNTNGGVLLFQNDTGTVASVQIHGDCINCSIATHADTTAGNNGGNVTVGGNFLGSNLYITTHGAQNLSGPGGSGGSVIIGGNAVINTINADGGDPGGASNVGGAGGDITVGGDLLISSTGASCTAIGGDGENGSVAGNGGNLTVSGSLVSDSFSPIDIRGGSNFAGSAGSNGGNGGNFTVRGSVHISEEAVNIVAKGGTGYNGGNAGELYVGGDFYCNATVDFRGGDNFVGLNGGNASASPRILGKMYIGSLFLSGGQGNGAGEKGLPSTNAIFSGGGFISTLYFYEGVNGSANSTSGPYKVLLQGGEYHIRDLRRTEGTTINEKIQIKNCTLSIGRYLTQTGSTVSANDKITNATGAGIDKTITNPESKLIKADNTNIYVSDFGAAL